eukprot:Gb_01577 [translate_table: standard]
MRTGLAWSKSCCQRWIIVTWTPHSHRNTLKHYAIQSHCITGLLHSAHLHKSKLLFVIYIYINNSITWSCSVSSYCSHNPTKICSNSLLISHGRKTTHIYTPCMPSGLLCHCLCRHYWESSKLRIPKGKHVRKHSWHCL